MLIRTEDLSRAVWNLLLFSDKNSPSGPEVEFMVSELGPLLVVSATDGIIGYTESFELLPDDTQRPGIWYLSITELKEIQKTLKEAPESSATALNLGGLYGHTTPAVDGFWQDMEGVYEGIELDGPWGPEGRIEASPWGIRFERFRVLSRLRSGGDYPMDFIQLEAPGGSDYIAYRVGPRIRGFISPVNRDVVRENLGKEALWRE